MDRGRIRAILASIMLAVYFIVFQTYTKGLPKSYILCSPDKRIYTVDQNITECILVHGKFIMDVGSLRRCLFLDLQLRHTYL